MEEVVEESEAQGDILFPSLQDGHDRLSYKVMAGYVWSYNQCRDVRQGSPQQSPEVEDWYQELPGHKEPSSPW